MNYILGLIILLLSALSATLAVAIFALTKQKRGAELPVLKSSIDGLIQGINQFGKDLAAQYGDIGAKAKEMLDTGNRMSVAATTLETALSASAAVKGSWGEKTLNNILGASDMKEGVDYFKQESIGGDGGLLRPDFIIKLPGAEKLSLVVDVKASLDEYMKAVKEKEPEHQKEHVEKFVAALRARIKSLSAKEYQKYLDDKIPYVVMFIPSEAACRAALDYDWKLFDEAQRSKVMLASPSTMIPLVLLIAHAWRQYSAMQNVEKLTAAFGDLGDRLETFFSHFEGIGLNLEQTTKKFNAAVGSYERMILPKIERIKDLGGTVSGATEIEAVEEAPRLIQKSGGK